MASNDKSVFQVVQRLVLGIWYRWDVGWRAFKGISKFKSIPLKCKLSVYYLVV